mgnify:CR=1 FL=1
MIPVWVIALLAALGAVCLALPLHIGMTGICLLLLAAVLLLVLFLLYFRFSPKDTIVVLLTPMSFILGIPYVMPLAMGLLGSPASAVSVGCGVIVTFFIRNIADGSSTFSAMEAEDMASRFRYIIDGFISNKGMILTIVAFTATIIIVYLIRRLSVDYAWTIAIIAGALADVMILLVGDLIFDTNVSILGLIIGTVVSGLLAKVIEFFAFHVDYSRTEKVQFEDDEYYYYVKAVPKITVSAPSRTVKKINTARRRPASTQGRR